VKKKKKKAGSATRRSVRSQKWEKKVKARLYPDDNEFSLRQSVRVFG
jgi:hypothetical protein